MTITLTYTVDDEHHERGDATRAINATDYAIALWNIQEELRTLDKYGEYEHEETRDVITHLRECVYDEVVMLPGYKDW